ncbi:hypothetical protein [Cryobacterium gelidum]|uniref:Uncharacterized protein n=1 Tax=Cryobacterium gelidum TaxID=1259164 RepID=A0A4R9AVV0_9MICO|nr:hypothetical protein [Cryobacterium gelidum]TFD70758.1 hypothetical protein E3T50_09280 [Cryobacterium gelidum]
MCPPADDLTEIVIKRPRRAKSGKFTGAPAELAPIIAAQASEASMYAALWRILPGQIGVRIILVLILVAAVLAVLATWVYPWMDGILNNQEATVGGA